jgi:hypothetical protein
MDDMRAGEPNQAEWMLFSMTRERRLSRVLVIVFELRAAGVFMVFVKKQGDSAGS